MARGRRSGRRGWSRPGCRAPPRACLPTPPPGPIRRGRGGRWGRTAGGRQPCPASEPASASHSRSASKQVRAPVWHAGPSWSTWSSTVSPSQSRRTALTHWRWPEVSPLTQYSLRLRLQYVARPVARVRASASSSIQPSISTSPVSCCWAMAGTSPASLRRSRSETAGSRSMQSSSHRGVRRPLDAPADAAPELRGRSRGVSEVSDVPPRADGLCYYRVVKVATPPKVPMATRTALVLSMRAPFRRSGSPSEGSGRVDPARERRTAGLDVAQPGCIEAEAGVRAAADQMTVVVVLAVVVPTALGAALLGAPLGQGRVTAARAGERAARAGPDHVVARGVPREPALARLRQLFLHRVRGHQGAGGVALVGAARDLPATKPGPGHRPIL